MSFAGCRHRPFAQLAAQIIENDQGMGPFVSVNANYRHVTFLASEIVDRDPDQGACLISA
jgi:hypothetical protein